MNEKKEKKLRRVIRKGLMKSPILEQAVKDQIDMLVKENNQLKVALMWQNKAIATLRKELAKYVKDSEQHKDEEGKGAKASELGEAAVDGIGGAGI
jgi:hypothetical protein